MKTKMRSIAAFGILVITQFAAKAELPSFVVAIDKCESLWSAKRYDELQEYIGQLDRTAPEYVPTRILVALRDEHFGEQFEDASNALRGLTNLAHGAICEFHPGFSARLGQMADSADSAVRVFKRIGQDKEFRKRNNDPRKRSGRDGAAFFLQRSFVDVPFLVPSLSLPSRIREARDIHQNRSSAKGLESGELAKMIFDKDVTFVQKQGLLDDYVAAIMARGGVKGLLESFDDDLVSLNAYGVVGILRLKGPSAIQALKEYLNHAETGSRSDSSLRMAAWALLQLAHNDCELASYFRELQTRVDERNPWTKQFLFRAVQHLDEGCGCDSRPVNR